MYPNVCLRCFRCFTCRDKNEKVWRHSRWKHSTSPKSHSSKATGLNQGLDASYISWDLIWRVYWLANLVATVNRDKALCSQNTGTLYTKLETGDPVWTSGSLLTSIRSMRHVWCPFFRMSSAVPSSLGINKSEHTQYPDYSSKTKTRTNLEAVWNTGRSVSLEGCASRTMASSAEIWQPELSHSASHDDIELVLKPLAPCSWGILYNRVKGNRGICYKYRPSKIGKQELLE